MKKVRIGIVGAGNIATNAHMPAYAVCDKAEIAAVAEMCIRDRLIPVLYILRQSVDVGIVKGGVSLWPSETSSAYYRMVLLDKGVYGPLMNSIYITVVGTALGVAVNAAAAYPMSRHDYKPRTFLAYYMVIIPMLFSGGIVPSFLLMRGLGLLNTCLLYTSRCV